MKFLVSNYSYLQNPWLGGYHPQIPVISVLNWIYWTPPPKKFLGTPLPSCNQRQDYQTETVPEIWDIAILFALHKLYPFFVHSRTGWIGVSLLLLCSDSIAAEAQLMWTTDHLVWCERCQAISIRLCSMKCGSSYELHGFWWDKQNR